MLSTFVSNIAGKGLAPKNRYRMSIRPPSAIGKFSNDMALMCDTIEFPGQNMMSSPDMMRHGPPREAVTGVSYASITASFLCTPDMEIKRFFENWQLLVMDMNTWEPNYYKNYITKKYSVKIDYLEIRNEKDLSTFKKRKKFRLFVAYNLGRVRLIDNH